MHTVIRFSLKLIIILIIVFGIHVTVLSFLELPLFENRIISAYLINCILAILIYLSLYLLKNKMPDQLGFLYMGGSFIKFLFFFLLFYPYYKQDGGLDSLEFAAFFTPYVISLILETLGVMEFLKK